MAKFYRINQFIQAKELRVLDAQNEQIGILSKEKALEKAKELGREIARQGAIMMSGATTGFPYW